jgi:hypothetical protein
MCVSCYRVYVSAYHSCRNHITCHVHIHPFISSLNHVSTKHCLVSFQEDKTNHFIYLLMKFKIHFP